MQFSREKTFHRPKQVKRKISIGPVFHSPAYIQRKHKRELRELHEKLDLSERHLKTANKLLSLKGEMIEVFEETEQLDKEYVAKLEKQLRASRARLHAARVAKLKSFLQTECVPETQSDGAKGVAVRELHEQFCHQLSAEHGYLVAGLTQKHVVKLMKELGHPVDGQVFAGLLLKAGCL